MVPPFAIGRGYWDNWLMRCARERRANLVDATGVVVAVHQDHDYGHVTGVPGDASDHVVLATEEAKQNLALAGGLGRLYTVYDATTVLIRQGRLISTLRPTMVRRRAKAWLRRVVALAPGGA